MTKFLSTFKYLDAPQLSPEWVAARVGRVTASELKRWMAFGVKGNSLQPRKDYERELAFEQKFNVPFSRFVTDAMEEGRVMEEYLKRQYSDKLGVVVQPCGAFYNDYFVASPDGLIGDDGLIECKWVFDNSFSDVLVNGVPEGHMLQMQGQMLASGRKWCDYVVGNRNTGRFKVIHVKADPVKQTAILASLEDVKSLGHEISDDGLYEFSDAVNTVSEGVDFL